jgi:hyaluronan synthase
MLIDKSLTPFALVIGPVVLVLSIFTGNWLLMVVLLTWWLVSRAIHVMPYLARKPGDIFILPAYILIAYYVSLVRAYALITINEHKYLTRDIPIANNRATRG